MAITPEQVAISIRDAMIALVGLPTPVPVPAPLPTPTPPPTSPTRWVTAYYPSWHASMLPIGNIDPVVTHVAHAFLVPAADGSLSGIAQAERKLFASGVHSIGKKAIISIGGDGAAANFRTALSAPALVTNIVALLQDGYDGFDIDFEPLLATDAAAFTAFVKKLRGAAPTAIITAAVANNVPIWAGLAATLDQINLMAYDLSGPWQGWVTWHEAALFDGGYVFPSTLGKMPSAQQMVDLFAASIVPAKLGLGLSLNATSWSGATKPMQSIVGTAVTYGITAAQVAAMSGTLVLDAPTQASYLSLASSFVSFDNPTACAAKANYARVRGLGGLMVWDLPSGQVNGSNPQVKALA